MTNPYFTPPVRRRNYGRGHGYQDAAGRKVPGVTTILSDGVPKPALINWAANTTAEYAVDHWEELGGKSPSARLKALKDARYADRDAAANRGTQVHKLAERLAAGDEVEVPDELAGHVDSYVKFLDDWDVQPVLSEFVVVSHRHGYAGTGDLIASLRHPELPGTREQWLLDVKTSRSGVFGETGLQLAAYRYAEVWMRGQEEVPMPAVERTGVVHVRADGYSLVPVEAGPAVHRTFLYAQQMKRFGDSARELVGDELLPPPAVEEAVSA